MRINHLIRKVFQQIGYAWRSSKMENGGKYLFVEDSRSNDLCIVFSSFGTHRTFNYVNTLKGVPVNKLFIADMWGYSGKGNKGSYYWFDKGSSVPEVQTSRMIERFIGKYERVYVIGSSKGGTAALYYGLKHGANVVISGACQYHIGTYLNDRRTIFAGMMGEAPQTRTIALLNEKLYKMIVDSEGAKTQIQLVYSKNEHTYPDELKDLICDLERYAYTLKEIVIPFNKHEEVGPHFAAYIKSYFLELK